MSFPSPAPRDKVKPAMMGRNLKPFIIGGHIHPLMSLATRNDRSVLKGGALRRPYHPRTQRETHLQGHYHPNIKDLETPRNGTRKLTKNLIEVIVYSSLTNFLRGNWK